MTSMTPRAPRQLPTLVTGAPRAWARDLAVVGGVTGVAAPGMVIFDPVFSLVAGFVGLATGAVLGACGCRVLDRMRRVVPLRVMALLAPVVGGTWGAVTGAAAGLFASTPFDDGGVALGFLFGGLAGSLQFTWLWFPYTFQSVVRGRTWPLVAAACLAGPWLGWAAFAVFLMSPALSLVPFAVLLGWLGLLAFRSSTTEVG